MQNNLYLFACANCFFLFFFRSSATNLAPGTKELALYTICKIICKYLHVQIAVLFFSRSFCHLPGFGVKGPSSIYNMQKYLYLFACANCCIVFCLFSEVSATSRAPGTKDLALYTICKIICIYLHVQIAVFFLLFPEVSATSLALGTKDLAL